MAISFDALLKLKASVDGAAQIDGLKGKLTGLGGAASQVRGGLGQMASGAQGLLGPIRALVPAVSAVGLVAMAKNALDNADALSKMAQRTGASVEALSRFQKAAELSDSSLEGVGKGLVQLSKSMVAAQTGTGKQAEAFRTLGISLTDANGKLKSTDEVMLEVADKFSGMEDGAEKTSLAMAILGKSGADLIPMLNMGRTEIEKLGGAMTTEFANKAAEFNDKLTTMSQKFGELGLKLGMGLLPALSSMADALLGVIEAFSQLPAPIQLALVTVVAFGPQLVALGKIFAGLVTVVKGAAAAIGAANIGGAIAGWLPVAVKAGLAIIGVVKGIVTGILALVTGPVGLTVLLIAGIIALVIAFRKPITDFFVWLGQAITSGLEALWKWGEPIRQFWKGIWDAVVNFAKFSLETIGKIIGAVAQTWLAITYQIFVRPWVDLWNNVLREPVMAMLNWISNAWKNISQWFVDNVVKPIQNAWNGFTKWFGTAIDNIGKTFRGAWDGLTRFFDERFIKPLGRLWQGITEFFPKAMQTAANAVTRVWNSVIQTVKNVINSILRLIGNAINAIGNRINVLIDRFNSLPGVIKLPRVPTLSVPQFAEGGYVKRPTFALVGEGGEPEYIIPESKMAAASANYLAGNRGGGILPSNAAQASSGGAAPQITIRTGPVMEFNGEQYVTVRDLDRALRVTVEGVIGRMRTPSARIALGLA